MKKETNTPKPQPKFSGEVQAMAEIEEALTGHGLSWEAKQRVLAWVISKYGARS